MNFSDRDQLGFRAGIIPEFGDNPYRQQMQENAAEDENSIDAGDWLLQASKGFMHAANMLPNLASMVGNFADDDFDDTWLGGGIKAVTDHFDSAIASAEQMQSQGFKAEMSQPVYNEQTGEWSLPSFTQVAGTITEALPQLPSYVGGAGLVKGGMNAGAKLAKGADGFAKLAKSANYQRLANAVGYGTAGGAFGASDTFSETYDSVRDMLTETDYTEDERDKIAKGLAKTAAITQMPVAAVTNAVGLGGAASMAKGSLLKALAKGAAVDAIPEAIEEGSQGYMVNLQTGKLDKRISELDGVINRAAMGGIVGGAMGAGTAGIEISAQRAQAQQKLADELKIDLNLSLDDITQGKTVALPSPEEALRIEYQEEFTPKTVEGYSMHDRPAKVAKAWREAEGLAAMTVAAENSINQRMGSSNWKDKNLINAVLDAEESTLTTEGKMLRRWAERTYLAAQKLEQAQVMDRAWVARKQGNFSGDDITNPQQRGESPEVDYQAPIAVTPAQPDPTVTIAPKTTDNALPDATFDSLPEGNAAIAMGEDGLGYQQGEQPLGGRQYSIAREIEQAQQRNTMGVPSQTELPAPLQNPRTGEKYPDQRQDKQVAEFAYDVNDRWQRQQAAIAEAKAQKIEMLRQRDQMVKNVADARWRRQDYRDGVEYMVGQLEQGGGISYVRDEQGKITGRTPSLNPAWFQNAPDDIKSLGVKGFRKAANKALKGERLGSRERRAVHHMLDAVQDERTSPGNIAAAKQNRDSAREERRFYGFDPALNTAPSQQDFETLIDQIQVAQSSFTVEGLDGLGKDLAEALHLAALSDVPKARINELILQHADDPTALTQAVVQATVEHINEQTSSAGEKSPAASEGLAGQPASVPAENAGRGTEQNPDTRAGETGFELTTQSEQELATKAKEQQASEQADIDAEKKADIDAQANDFLLTGSNSEADQAAARGQNSLFDAGGKPAESKSHRTSDDLTTQPSDAQIAADNYPKKHIQMHGLNIAIENVAGSKRSGEDEQGNAWSNTIHFDYGDIKGTKGADGDPVDVFIGPNLTSDKVFVVNQTHKGKQGKFDEHKVMLGFNSLEKAEAAYVKNYDQGWDNYSDVVATDIHTFKDWVKDEANTQNPFPSTLAEQNQAAAQNSESNLDGQDRSNETPEAEASPSEAGREPQSKGAAGDTDLGVQDAQNNAAQPAEAARLSQDDPLSQTLEQDYLNNLIQTKAWQLKERQLTDLGTALAGNLDVAAKEAVRLAKPMAYLEHPFYLTRKENPEQYRALMTAWKQVDDQAIIKNIIQEVTDRAASTNGNLESNRTAGTAENGLGESDVSADTRAAGQESGRAGDEDVASRVLGQGNTELSDGSTVADGAGSVERVHNSDGTITAKGSPAGAGNRDGRSEPDDGGVSPTAGRRQDAEPAATGFADLAQRKAAQDKAESLPVKLNDPANIRETLPMLLPEQQGDVVKAEDSYTTRKGMLFTNGTGTGKTYTGLGTAKRFYQRGKKRILIVTPGEAKNRDWVEDGKNLNLPISILPDTQSAGTDAVITTYANFRDNPEVQKTQWDLVIYDESHKIMENKQGEMTATTEAHFTTTIRDQYRAKMKATLYHPAEWQAVNDANDALVARRAELDTQGIRWAEDKELERISRELKRAGEAADKVTKVTAERLWQEEQADPTQVLFLSASPFVSVKNLRYADGYLFNSDEGFEASGAYNQPGSGFDSMLMSEFGYQMRTGKLTQPEADVDTGLMEREFADKLMKSGAMSGRSIEVDADYGREFIKVNSALGEKIDKGMFDVINHEDYPEISSNMRGIWNYLYRARLLEAMNAAEGVERIEQHLALGRKVVVFHNYNEATIANPFDLRRLLRENGKVVETKLKNEIIKFEREHPELISISLDLHSVPKTLKDHFGDKVGFYSGHKDVKKTRLGDLKDFNRDDGTKQIMVIQKTAGKEGISLHDVTGHQQRALMVMGLPGSPADTIQMEGRVYRLGVQTDAIFEYLATGLRFEQWAYADSVAQGARTAENLAMGNSARDLETAFKEGYLDAQSTAPSKEQGKGSKAADQVARELDPFANAKSYYFKRQKKTSRNKAQEGADYFATPEPLGLKMVEWANQRNGDDNLEPSAGHGAIARFFNPIGNNKAIEPSSVLASELGVRLAGDAINGTFENHNLVNKYDTIVMNPPFGRSGATAMQHLGKAFKHLRDGGRVVALIPEGPAAEKAFNKLYESKDAADIYQVADIKLPTVTFERAGTKVMTRVVILDKHVNNEDVPGYGVVHRDYTRAEKISELFDWVEHESMPERIAPKVISVEQESSNDGALNEVERSQAAVGGLFEVGEFDHTKTGETLYVAKQTADDYELFKAHRTLAKKHGGYYNGKTYGGKAKTGFVFTSEQARADFVQAANEQSRVKYSRIKSSVKPKGSQRRIWNGVASEPVERLRQAILANARRIGDDATVQSLSAPGSIVQVPAHALRDHVPEGAEAIERAFGKTIIYYQTAFNTSVLDRVNGVNIDSRYLYINVDSLTTVDATRIAGHEFLHALRKDNELLYQQIAQAVRPHLDQADWKGFYDWVGQKDKSGQFHELDDDTKREEYIADLVGNYFADGGWLKFVDEAQRPSLARRVWLWLKQWVRKVLKRDQTLKGGTSINNRQALNNLLTGILKDYQAIVQGRRELLDIDLAKTGPLSFLTDVKQPDGSLMFSRAEEWAKTNHHNPDIDSHGSWELYEDETHIESFIRKIQDKFFRVKQVQDSIRKSGGQLDDSNDVYRAEELSHGRIEEALRTFEKRHVEPLVNAMAKAKVDQVMLDDYLYAKHAKERNAHIAEINPDMPDGGSGMSNADADRILQQFEAQGHTAKLEALAKQVYAINKLQQQAMIKAGLESQETIDSWGKYDHYVPLKGHHHQSGFMRRVASGFNVKGKETRQALGRRSRAESPLLHTIAQLENSLLRAEKNRVAQRFLKLVQDNPNGDLWEYIHSAHGETIRRFNPVTREVEYVPNTALRNDPDVFVVKVKGKERYIRVKDERLIRAMKNLGPEPMNAFFKALASINRGLAALNTTLNPEFVISNFARDIQTAMANLVAESDPGLGARKLKDKVNMKAFMADVPKAMKGVFRAMRDDANSGEWESLFREYRDAGGKVGFFGLDDFDTKASKIEGMLKEASGGTEAQLRKGFRGVAEWVRHGNDAIENASRLVAFKIAKDQGLGSEQAASLAKNLTVNFNRKGEWGASINALYLFANASIQGTAQLVRVMKSKRGQYLAGGLFAASLMLAELNRMLGGEDEDGEPLYDDVPDHVKERNLVLMVPGGEGKFISLPLPYGYNVFHVAGTLLNDVLHGTRDTSSASAAMAGVLVGAFSPLGLETSDNWSTAMAKLASPTILDPAVQLATNENFHGAPIYNEGFGFGTPKPDSALYWRGTGEVAKWLSTSLNAVTGGSQYRSGWADVSPDSIEHIFDFATGGAGAFVRRLGVFGQQMQDEAPVELHMIPFSRKVLGKAGQHNDIDRYYDRRDDLRQIEAEWKDLQAIGEPGEARTFQQEYGGHLRMISVYRNAEKSLRKLRDTRRKIEAAKGLSSKEKQQRIELLNKRIDQVMDGFNKRWGQYVKAA